MADGQKRTEAKGCDAMHRSKEEAEKQQKKEVWRIQKQNLAMLREKRNMFGFETPHAYMSDLKLV